MRQDGVEVGLPLMVGSPAPRDAGDRPGLLRLFGFDLHVIRCDLSHFSLARTQTEMIWARAIQRAGGTLGILLGGFIASSFDWHWVFLLNIPFGVLVYALCVRLIPVAPAEHRTTGRLDLTGPRV